jgi:hypothetical protein
MEPKAPARSSGLLPMECDNGIGWLAPAKSRFISLDKPAK